MVLWQRTEKPELDGIDFKLEVTQYLNITKTLLVMNYAPDELRRLRKEMLQRAKLEIERDIKANDDGHVPTEWKVGVP